MITLIFGLSLLYGMLFLPGNHAYAHKPSDSYLGLKVKGTHIEGQWDISLRDLEFAIGLDENNDRNITWGELRNRHSEIANYVLPRLKVQADNAFCPPNMRSHLVDHHSDGAYAILNFSMECPSEPKDVVVDYGLFFDLDPTHRGLLRLEYLGHTQTAIFSPDRPTQRLNLSHSVFWDQFLDFGREGVWHIWIGFDHILFLICLLLPAVLKRETGRWKAVSSFHLAFWDVLKIVTAFTLAHSITLGLATLGAVQFPSRWVESAIAASVILAALNNIVPIFKGRLWTVAFVFGLIHGFGFASALVDLGLPQGSLLLALVGFNLGVEIGQLMIVVALVPLSYAIRRSWFYQRFTLVLGSCLIVTVASIWLLERALNITLLSF